MRIIANNVNEAISSFDVFDNASKGDFVTVKYLDLGVTKVRLIINSKDFLSLIEHQLTCSISDSVSSYSSTIIAWNESDPENLSEKVQSCLSKDLKLRFRLQKLLSKKPVNNFEVFSKSDYCPVISFDCNRGIINAYDPNSNTYYYAAKNLEPEEFLKEGHIFVQILNKVLKTPTSNLVHGAVIGLENKGILFCARGQRGKSTLSVLSMLNGFEYVSDDYLVLEQTKNKLLSYPIYSIITLSPKMYNQLFDKLKGVKFISNNARKDKYVFNIESFHDRFKKAYPIELCMFPEIVPDSKPSIVQCPKGRAITQIVQSTVSQMGDMADSETIKKLIAMVCKYDYYQINLCSDINLNVDYLRQFMANYKCSEQNQEFKEQIIEDITFDIANIIDCHTGALYTMNKFATNLYEILKSGISISDIKNDILKRINSSVANTVCMQIDKFNKVITELGLLSITSNKNNQIAKLNFDFVSECDYNLSIVKFYNKTLEELLN